jgi:serine/threonine-protein kinase
VECPDENTVLGFITGGLSPSQIASVEKHARACSVCQELISVGVAARSFGSGPTGEQRSIESATARAELSCRYVGPLLDLANERLRSAEVARFLRSWCTSERALRDELGWVTLRFCEALTQWLAEQVGIDAIIAQTLQESYSPKTMGMLYPFVRAFGSPRLGYRHLPALVRVLNRISNVEIISIARNRATIAYGPRTEAFRERNPLICRVRRAQLAAGPRLWQLPDAVVDEAECQARGGDRCVYQLRWAEPALWWRSMACGALIAVPCAVATSNWQVTAAAAGLGIMAVHLFRARRELRQVSALAGAKISVLPRIAGRSSDKEGGRIPPRSIEVTTDALEVPTWPSPPQVGQLIAGRYRLQKLMGAGGMSFVYEAVDQATAQAVALKVLRPELASDPRWVERIVREVRIARTIRHANVCQVMSFGQAERYYFLTMELATGGTLLRELTSAGPHSSWKKRLADVRAVINGLAAVHRARVVHRDLTPQNVLRFADGRLAIADFGLALDQSVKTTAVAGTFGYIAPEILGTGKPSYASDVWQLGILIGEILSGPRSSMEARSPNRAPPALVRLLAACTDNDPGRRPHDAGVVARALEDFDAAGALGESD